MAEKKSNAKLLDEQFKDSSKKILTYEDVIITLGKAPTAANAKKVVELSQKYSVTLLTKAETIKQQNIRDAEKRALEIERLIAEDGSDFDILKEKELLEWSRSDSPVRMYLREMGQIPLLTKDEEIEISKKIKFGEEMIIDAVCSVPYLIDYILGYKEALINRERRVKELFKSFEDDSDDSEEDSAEEKEEKKSAKRDKRVDAVVDSFKALDKAKKDWTKHSELELEEGDEIKVTHQVLTLTFKKQVVKEKLLELGPTSKLITELVRAMETALKSESHFERELKKLEYKLPLFNDSLKENHQKILSDILELSKEDIIAAVPEATMVSVYMDIKKLKATEEASKDS